MSAPGPRASYKQSMNEEHGWIQYPSLSRLEDSAPARTLRGDALTGSPLAVLQGSSASSVVSHMVLQGALLQLPTSHTVLWGSLLPLLTSHTVLWGSLLPLPASHTPHWVTQSLPSVSKESTCNAGDPGLIPGSGRSAGEGNGYTLQYSWASLWLSW